MDAICKQRGSVKDGTGVSDSVVNQLLSKIDVSCIAAFIAIFFMLSDLTTTKVSHSFFLFTNTGCRLPEQYPSDWYDQQKRHD